MKVYHVETQQGYDSLMSELEEKGYEWLSGYKPTEYNYWEENKEDSCINILGKYIGFMNIERSKNRYPNIPIIEYKAKGENMTQEEMTQKEMKYNIFDWARDVSVAVESFFRDMSEAEADLQEAKSSAKKLIEKIDEYLETLKLKFKVGDYVVDERFDYMTKIKRISNGFVYGGKIYELDDSRFGEFNFGCPIESIRQPKSEEIAEYEVALTFHKHGRKPFEVKEGDLLENKFGRYTAHEYSFSKEDFTVGGNTLLKTFEELNEWLENK